MKVVADSGPLIAFAKIGGLGTLFDLYPEVLTPRAVHEETVHEGDYVKAPDAALLRAEYDAGRLRVERIMGTVPAGIEQLGRGERQSIQLAIQLRAEWLLADDLEARQTATRVFALAGAPTRVKGTLGMIVSAYTGGLITLERSLELLTAIRSRKDIWVSPDLCRQVEDTLRRASLEA